jgi:hypothetical protein
MALQHALEQEQAVALRRQQPSAPPSSWRVLDLDRLPGLPCMPTLNGWLLEYGVVYLVRSREEAAAASRALSGCALDLVSFHLPWAAAVQLPQQQALLAFSLPADLHDARAAAAAEGVQRRLRGRLQGLQRQQQGAAAGSWRGLWGDAAMSVERLAPRPINL